MSAIEQRDAEIEPECGTAGSQHLARLHYSRVTASGGPGRHCSRTETAAVAKKHLCTNFISNIIPVLERKDRAALSFLSPGVSEPLPVCRQSRRGLCEEALLKIRGVISFTFQMAVKRCVVRIRSDLTAEVRVQLQKAPKNLPNFSAVSSDLINKFTGSENCCRTCLIN